MRVHLISDDIEGGRILSRTARILVDRLNWTASGRPSEFTDVNYFHPYLHYSAEAPGKTAAWFTHYDASKARKREQWVQAEENVDLRLTHASMYFQRLADRGATEYLPAPVDSEHFDIRENKTGSILPRVGVSGFVYGDNRKGEKLVSKLAQDLSGRIEVVASGSGWPVRSHFYEYTDLPQYYNGLNVFLCASSVEGIPMPPLEALACGIPVVIPKGVGLLDTLPDIPGIYRFTKGSFPSMKAAVSRALAGSHDREALRNAVSGHTIEAWCDTHLTLFERYFCEEFPEEELSSSVGKSGVYFVAFGNPARSVVGRAMSSWKEQMPQYPIALASSEPHSIETFFVSTPDSDVGGRLAKLNAYYNAPEAWEYILYLDADTETVADVSFFFDALSDGWELVICKNPNKYYTTKRMHRPDNVDEINKTLEFLGSTDLIQWNGGVFSFRRSDRVRRFFDLWKDEWLKHAGRDQAALLRALWQQPLRILTLGNEWNTVEHYALLDRTETAGIKHYPGEARRWVGKMPGRLDGEEAWRQVTK